MSQIQIKEIKTKSKLKQFVEFPNQLYKNHPYYVPSLVNDEMEIFNEKENPVFDFSICKKLLAYQNEKIVGRIALIINRKESEELNIQKVRFGWFDFIEDFEVAKTLIDEAIKFAKENNYHKIEGPMGFTNLDKSGMLVMGYDKIATMIGLYNPPYYSEYVEKLGMIKANEWVEFFIELRDTLPDKVLRFSEILKQKYKLKSLVFKTKQELVEYADQMFELLDETYKVLPTYVPLSQKQTDYYKKKYIPFINKDFVICIADENNKLIGFAITMPSYSVALQKAKGKLFPFGWYHLLKASKHNQSANFYLIGIHPEYQKKGITAIVMKEFYDLFHSKGIKYLETNPELEDNKNIQLLWREYNPVNHKRRRTYSLEF